MSEHRFRRETKAGFMCECGASLCEERIGMSAHEYDSSLDPRLVEGHGPGGELEKCSVCGRPNGRQRRRRR